MTAMPVNPYVSFVPRPFTGGLRLALAILCVGCLSKHAGATELKLKAQLDGSVEYDDNILLTSTTKQSAERYSVHPVATLSAANERNQATLEGSGYVERFDGVSGRDVNDYSVSFNDQYRASELMTLGLNASYDRQSLLRAELLDTGLIAQSGHRRSITGGASIAYQLSETDGISLSGSYNDSAYSSALLTDYVSYQVGAAWNKRISDRVSIVTSISGAAENPASVLIPDSRYAMGSLGFDYATSETTSVGASAGGYYLDRGAPLGGEAGFSASAHATAKTEFTTFSLEASHGASPSGVGQLVRSTDVSVTLSHRLGEHLYFDADAAIRFVETQGIVSFALNRKYYDGSAALRWEFGRYFALSTHYRHSRQQIAGGGLWADANRVGATLTVFTEPRE
jgi:hypothetical protein